MRLALKTLPLRSRRPSKAVRAGGGAVLGAKKFMKWCALVLGALILALACISWIVREAQDRADLHTRSFCEFTEAFNTAMKPRDITVGEHIGWNKADPRFAQGLCAMMLPDGGEVPCAVELWGTRISSAPIRHLTLTFTSVQAEYLVPVVQGVFDVFKPEFDEQTLSDIMGFCDAPFGQETYEKIWQNMWDCNFYMISESPESVTAKWYFTD